MGGNSRLTVTLDQPCVIRSPKWGFINCSTGAKTFANTVTVVNNTTFYFDFVGVISTAIAFVDVPYQDMQVQNFQGGFVKPGGQWFRKPT